MPKINANGAEFYYELHGKGQPLILVSGYSCDHFIWLPILQSLSQKFRVLIFNNRGVGQTKDKNEPLSADLCADDVMALANALNLKKPYVAGHSMGGTIVQCIGAKYSPQVGKLAILNSSAKWRQAALKGLYSILLMGKAEVDFGIISDQIASWCFGESFLKDAECVATFKQNMLGNPFPQSIENQERQFKVLVSFDGRKNLEKIKVPTIVISGKQDILSLPYESEFIASHIPNAKLVELDSGHASFADVPDQLAHHLQAFFQ